MRSTSMQAYVVGGFAGLIGTLAHTAAMLSAQACLPRARSRPVPPRAITHQVAGKRGETPDTDRVTVATAAAHFGYGALAGALYAALGSRRHRRRPVARGVAYGLGIWAVSYLGWLPAFRILPPANRMPAQQNAMMLLAHVAWGAAFGAAFDRYQRITPDPDASG